MARKVTLIGKRNNSCASENNHSEKFRALFMKAAEIALTEKIKNEIREKSEKEVEE